MFKIIMLVKKKESISKQEFIELWEEHSEKILQVKDILNIKSYTKTLPVNDNNFDFDGMGELWYDNKDDFIQGRSSEAGKRAIQTIKNDEHKFIDVNSSIMWFGIEDKII